ncbi:hypothetical protein FSP39_000216 [Pinctada imbricata]|uniref:Protein kinase domain-containing protein n=1 Tax=Pinctada imbricata TaxID=66713 RepID=A0AA89BTN9_PINIB|nr:hypothetical protein FSP39_000216 [Pinctada imbricata]
MNTASRRPRLYIPSHGPRKKDELLDNQSNLGSLTPDLQPAKPDFPQKFEEQNVFKIGRYLLLDQLEGETFKAVNWQTKEESICKVFPIHQYRDALAAYWQVDDHPNISSISEIILGETKAYVIFERHYGDLHSYVRQKRRLKEEETARLFEQIVTAVQHCHENGIVLRDLKLRKFVFKNPERSELRLDGLEDAFVLDEDDNDKLTDKHGCPAYVSPEILNANQTYSGRAADMWSLGVMLYTMLSGKYPFHDPDPTALFGKIRRGQYSIPPTLSAKAKCLIKNLLRREPLERLSAGDILQHPWIRDPLSSGGFIMVTDSKTCDQTVPNMVYHEGVDDFFL